VASWTKKVRGKKLQLFDEQTYYGCVLKILILPPMPTKLKISSHALSAFDRKKIWQKISEKLQCRGGGRPVDPASLPPPSSRGHWRRRALSLVHTFCVRRGFPPSSRGVFVLRCARSLAAGEVFECRAPPVLDERFLTSVSGTSPTICCTHTTDHYDVLIINFKKSKFYEFKNNKINKCLQILMISATKMWKKLVANFERLVKFVIVATFKRIGLQKWRILNLRYLPKYSQTSRAYGRFTLVLIRHIISLARPSVNLPICPMRASNWKSEKRIKDETFSGASDVQICSSRDRRNARNLKKMTNRTTGQQVRNKSKQCKLDLNRHNDWCGELCVVYTYDIWVTSFLTSSRRFSIFFSPGYYYYAYYYYYYFASSSH